MSGLRLSRRLKRPGKLLLDMPLPDNYPSSIVAVAELYAERLGANLQSCFIPPL